MNASTCNYIAAHRDVLVYVKNPLENGFYTTKPFATGSFTSQKSGYTLTESGDV